MMWCAYACVRACAYVCGIGMRVHACACVRVYVCVRARVRIVCPFMRCVCHMYACVTCVLDRANAWKEPPASGHAVRFTAVLPFYPTVPSLNTNVQVQRAASAVANKAARPCFLRRVHAFFARGCGPDFHPRKPD